MASDMTPPVQECWSRICWISSTPPTPIPKPRFPSRPGSLAHPDEAAVVLPRQRPKEGADVGALEEEADRVDADSLLAVDRRFQSFFSLARMFLLRISVRFSSV